MGLSTGLDQDYLASLEVERNKAQNIRAKIWSLRSTIHENRRALRAKQYAKSHADDQYIQQVRLCEAFAAPGSKDMVKVQERIAGLFAQCERIRDEYGPLEDDCNMLEDELSRHECELSKSEDIIFRILNDMKIAGHANKDIEKPSNVYARPQPKIEENPSALIEDTQPTSRSEEFTELDSDISEQFHPLVSKYLSKLGDIDLLRERIAWNEEEKDTIDEENIVRRPLGIYSSQENDEWLRNYDQAQMSLNKELEIAQDEAGLLRQDCLLQGLIDMDDNPTDFATQERFAFSNEDIVTSSQASAYVKFSALLLRPLTSEMTIFKSYPVSDEMAENTGDRINKWLLHILRFSPLDVHLLASIFEIKYGRKNENWQSDVLKVWFGDGAETSPSGHDDNSFSPSPTKCELTPIIQPMKYLEAKLEALEVVDSFHLQLPILPTSKSDGPDTRDTFTLES